MMLLATLTLTAVVLQDEIPLRAAPQIHAPQQATLWQGDTLEVRGEKVDYLQVYDHRRERAGYVRARYVRVHDLQPESAPQLLAAVQLLRDLPDQEALSIAYAALFLKAARPEDIGADIFDALGTLADRLAQRASIRRSQSNERLLAAHIEVASTYGVVFKGIEQDAHVNLCYDGEAFRRVLALNNSSPQQRARAALGLTRPECVSPELPIIEKQSWDLWRSEVLDRVETEKLSGYWANRIKMRRAGVWAGVAFDLARQGKSSKEAGQRAIDALASVNKTELSEEDATSYTEAAVRVGVSRWAAVPVKAPAAPIFLETVPGKAPGETCIHLFKTGQNKKKPLWQRCTYGLVWPASASVSTNAKVLTLAVQPLATWRELWVFKGTKAGWGLDILVPGENGPGLGYLEFAGFSPDSTRLLTGREVRGIDGKFARTFEVMQLDTLAIEKQADSPNSLTPFYRWQSPRWKQGTLMLR
jgi:hypothetical protein